MSVKIFIKRHIKKNCIDRTLKMLGEFRLQASKQPGYISGETLLNHYDAYCLTIISTWQSLEDWIRWQNSGERDKNEARIEELLDQPTEYEVYDVYLPGD